MSKRTNPEIEEAIVRGYENGKSNSNLAKEFSLHRGMIQRILLRNGVKLHKAKSQIKCNKNFFGEYTPESCYWAGFLLAEGYLRSERNSLEIGLNIKDLKHLEKFLTSISCSEFEKIKVYGEVCKLVICLDEFKRDLIENFGVTPKKTYIAEISEKIPLEYLHHFVRGYFDGDGCITKTSCKSISFVGTESVLNKLNSVFYDLGIKLKSKNVVAPLSNVRNGIGTINYSGKNAKIILDWIYRGSSSLTRLDRKYQKYLNYEK